MARTQPESTVSEPAPTPAGVPTRRPTAKGQRREAAIYDVAAEIFQQKGYASTSLRDIADALGMLKGSLYYYIDSKEDLLHGIVMAIHADGQVNLEHARSLDGSPLEKLRALVEGQVIQYGRRLSWVRVFYTEYRSLSGERRLEITERRREYGQYVQDLIAKGQSESLFCPELDLRIATNSVLSVVNMVYQWYRPERDGSLERVARQQSNFVIRGLRCSPDHQHRT